MTIQYLQSAVFKMQPDFGTKAKVRPQSEIFASTGVANAQHLPAIPDGVCELEAYGAIMAEIMPLIVDPEIPQS